MRPVPGRSAAPSPEAGEEPVFRYRIKDLMIANAVLAGVLAAVMTLGHLAYVIPASTVVALLIFGPLAWVETYLYRKKKGAWYRWKHPRMRPRHDLVTFDLPPRYPRAPFPGSGLSQEGDPSEKRARTRLFEATSSSEPVSRASLLLTVALKLEKAGRADAATKVYDQLLKDFAGTAPARDAARRLRSLRGQGVPLKEAGPNEGAPRRSTT
jgi:hypothetical protein